MNWLVYSLITVILWGVGQVLIKKGFTNISSLWSLVISASINALVYIPFALLTGATFSISPLFFVVIFVITALNMFFFYAIEKGQLAFSGTIFATYPVTTIVLSYIFLQENPSAFQFLMIALILFGSGLLAYTAKSDGKKQTLFHSWIFWALLGSIGVGTADFLAKISIGEVGLPTYNLFFPITYILGLCGYWFIDKNGRNLSKNILPKQFIWTIGGVLLLTLGLLSFNYALEHGNVSIVATISSSYAALTILLAYIFLHEKISRQQLVAIVCIVIGIIFIGF